MKRCVTILALIFANIILLVHTIVAHHHNGYVVVTCSYDMSHHNGTSHLPSSNEECHLKNITLTKQFRFFKQVIKSVMFYDIVEEYELFKYSIKEVVENFEYIESLYNFIHVHYSFGRAPPMC